MNKGITVKELRSYCDEMIDLGYGDRHIQISSDDEGSNFHRLIFKFTTNEEGDLSAWIEDGMMEYGIDNPDEIIVLG